LTRASRFTLARVSWPGKLLLERPTKARGPVNFRPLFPQSPHGFESKTTEQVAGTAYGPV
jgi:hypothetical protein